MTSLNPDPQLVDGVDVDAVAAAVRTCAGVDDLDGGPLGSVTSYLPGRKVAGIKVEPNRVTVAVRLRWAVPVAEVGAQIRAAVTSLIAPRTLDIVVSDVADPPAQPPLALPAGPSDSEVEPWTNSDGNSDALSSRPTTQITAGTPAILPPA